MMGIEIFQITLALLLMLVNVLVFIDGRHGVTAATQGARGFAVAAFASAIVALMAVQHLMIQVWIHPKDETTFLIFREAMSGMGFATSAAVALWVLSRWRQ